MIKKKKTETDEDILAEDKEFEENAKKLGWTFKSKKYSIPKKINSENLIGENFDYEEEDTLDNKFHASLNINTLISYLSSSPKSQLRTLTISLRKFFSKGDVKEEVVNTIDDFFTSEIYRIVGVYKRSLSSGGAPLATYLGLSKYGSEISIKSNELYRLLKLAAQQQETQLVIAKDTQIKLNAQLKEFVNSFRKQFLYSLVEIPMDENIEVDTLKLQSDTYKSDTTLFVYDINDVGIDIIEHEIFPENGVINILQR